MKATVIGSIWAAIEIVAGSFLHNLRIPFSGTMLSMTAVFLLVAFSMHWKERGIIIRAGLVAAIMKSISPSAIILGPMLAITVEAMILEITSAILGRNLAGFISGGMLAVAWALVQRIISLLILYGFDLVKIAEAFYYFLVKITGLENMPPIYLLMLVIFIFLSAGALAAIAGYFSYKRLSRRNNDLHSLPTPQSVRQNPFEIKESDQRYSYIYLFISLAAIIVTLFLLNTKQYLPASILAGFFIAFVLTRYKNSLRYIRKPRLWIQLLVITLLASLLWEWIDTGIIFSIEGLIIGIELMARALIIVLGFSAISVELRNPVIRSLLYKNGFSNLYKSVSLAFSTLPAVIEILPEKNKIYSERRHILGKILQFSEHALSDLRSQLSERKNIFIITGGVQSGKTTFLEKTIQILRKENFRTAGILCKGTFKENKRFSFSVHSVEGNENYLLASREKHDNWLHFSSFYFNPEGFTRGKKLVQQGIKEKADVLVLDEIGPVELRGNGWTETIDLLLKQEQTVQIWVVREKILREVTDRWNIHLENIVDITNNRPEELLRRIIHFSAK